MKNYDLIVIGGGPGGYVAAIRASQLGLKVVCIEKIKQYGGTCLNIGCIPSKTLLHSSHLYDLAKNHMKDFGVIVKGEINIDLKKMMDSKDKIVSQLTIGVKHLLKKNKVDCITGFAKFKNKNTISVSDKDFSAKNILISTGSSPTNIDGINLDEKNIVSSTGALSFNEVPKTLVVIGGGYIGLELGLVWKRLGSRVIVIEYLDRIVPTMDKDAAKTLFNSLKKQGIEFLFNTKVIEAKLLKNKVSVKYSSNIDSKIDNIQVDKVLLSIGRKPFIDGLGIEKLGVQLNKTGTIKTNKNFETSVKGIFAIGDVIDGPMLAHKASAEGHAFAEKISGHKANCNYDAIPAVIYTDPEVAWVGLTEEELDKNHIKYKKGSFPFSANARGKTTGEVNGSIKILVDENTDRILGVHIVGAHAGELIGEAVTAIETGLSGEDLALICHAHPTLSESFKEAASLASFNTAVHI